MLYTKTLLQISSLSIITETVKGSKLHALLKGPKIILKIARKYIWLVQYIVPIEQ